MYSKRSVVIATLAMLAAGCATDIAATSLSETVNTQTPGHTLTLQYDVTLDLPRGYSADDLRQSSTWRQVGTLPQGDVLSPVSWPLIVKAGPPQYDAELVVHQNAVVGVYIPSRSAFVAAATTRDIAFTEGTPK